MSVKNRVQEKIIHQLKFNVNDTYKQDEIKTKIEASKDEDVINNSYLDTKLAEVKGHVSCMENDYNEFIDLERSNEEVLNEKTPKTTIR